MKKSSIAVAVTVLIITILGVLYINNSYNLKKMSSGGSSKVDSNDKDQGSEPNDTVFGEYNHLISENDNITVKYLKSGGSTKIYALYPVENKDKYYISQNGSIALYVGKQGHIWVLYSSGSKKKVTPDRYDSIDKAVITKTNSDYIWADKPELTPQGNIRFVSNLPGTSGASAKSIWEISLQDSSMKKIFTPVSAAYKVLGYRDDGRFLVLDDKNIAVIDDAGNVTENIDVNDKSIISLSPDGTKIVYFKKDSNQTVFSKQYILDSYGKKSVLLPAIEGYSATDMGAWNGKGTKYAFVIKSISGNKHKIGVINFEEGFIEISSHEPGADIKFPDDCKLKWTEDDIISVDIGDDVVSIELQ